MELQGGSSTSCPIASEGQHQHLVPPSHQTDCPDVKAASAVRAHETEVREEAAVCLGKHVEIVWSVQPFTDEEARNRDYTLDEGCPGYRHGSPILQAVMCTGESIYANFPGFCGPHELPANTKPVAIGWRYMSASPAAHCTTCFCTLNDHQQRLRPIVHAPEVPPGGQVTVIPFKVFPGYIVLGADGRPVDRGPDPEPRDDLDIYSTAGRSTIWDLGRNRVFVAERRRTDQHQGDR